MTGRGTAERSWLAALAGALAALLLLPGASAAAAARSQAGGPGAIDPGQAVAKPPTRIGFWAGEAVPGTDWDEPDTYWAPRDTHFYTPRLWRVLRRNRIPLYFNLRYKRDFGPIPPGKPHHDDALRIIRTANRLGVPVWAWVLVPYSDGYWAWEGDAAQQFAAVRSLTAWAKSKHVELRGLALDPEPRLRTPFETTSAIMGGGDNPIFSALFREALDPVAQCVAWRGYARIVDWAKRRQIPIVAAPMPAALDDIGDRSLALQDAASFILPDAPWNALYFQAYRSVFAYYSGRDPGPGIVSAYLRTARREFGSVGQVSLGSAGRGPYRRFASLLNDVRLAATLGAREVPIYSLERTLRSYGGPRAVTRLARAARHPYLGPAASRSVATTSGARTLRGAVHRADRAATASTPEVSAARGATMRANSWPNGCGS
ncbi:MAG TPA: hypothetical protein VG816_01090 [Solirubrobacterales bacterium]|nr:hypothetical protein [Solirubrobacterales bacterium]